MAEYPQWFIEELVNEEDRNKAIKGELRGVDVARFKCNLGHEYTMIVRSHMYMGSKELRNKCPECKRIKMSEYNRNRHLKNRPNYPEWFIEDIYNEDDKKRALDKTLTSMDTIKFKCDVHTKYSQLVYNHLSLKSGKRKCGCPYCAESIRNEHTSKFEHEIQKYVKSKYKGMVRCNARGVIKNPRGGIFELDVYLPEINLAIECNGEYYHKENMSYEEYLQSNRKSGKYYGYHKEKEEACKNKGIYLINIWYLEYEKNKSKFRKEIRDRINERI